MYNQPFRVAILQTLFDLQGRLKINTKHTIPTWMPFLSKFLFSSWISSKIDPQPAPLDLRWGYPLVLLYGLLWERKTGASPSQERTKFRSCGKKKSTPRENSRVDFEKCLLFYGEFLCEFLLNQPVIWNGVLLVAHLQVPLTIAVGRQMSFFFHITWRMFMNDGVHKKEKKLATAVNTLWTDIFLAG